MSRKAAEDLWRTFHQKANPSKIATLKNAKGVWPKEWFCVGRLETVYYHSDKWYEDQAYNYYHDTKACCWHPRIKRYEGLVEDDLGIVFPFARGFPTDLTVLGECIGWDLIGADGKIKSAETDSGELLCAAPDGRVLVSLHPRHGVSAVLSGRDLRVEARGIVG